VKLATMAVILALCALLLLSVPVTAQNSEYEMFGGTLAGGTPSGSRVGIMTSNPSNPGVVRGDNMQRFEVAWSPTRFCFDKPEMVFVEVIGPGSSFSGHSSQEWANWLRQSLISKLSAISRPSRFTLVSKGQPCAGDIIFRIPLKVITGKEMAQESSSSSDSDRYSSRRGSSSTNRSKDSDYTRQDSGMYMSAKLEIVRYLGNGRETVIAAPDIRVSASDGFQLAESASSSSNKGYAYSSNKRGTSSSFQERESNSHSWKKDEKFEQAQQGDALTNYLANGLVAAGTRALATAFQQDQVYQAPSGGNAGTPIRVNIIVK